MIARRGIESSKKDHASEGGDYPRDDRLALTPQALQKTRAAMAIRPSG
jgi:hypothetical protein